MQYGPTQKGVQLLIRPSEIAEILTAAPQAQIQANLLSGPIQPSDLAIRGFYVIFCF